MSAPFEEPASEGAPDWMVSYADMITILMSFFAVMFSMAMAKDTKKDAPMIKSLQRQFGAIPTTTYPFGAVLTSNGAANVTPQFDQGTIGGVIYFDSPASDLTEDQREQLATLAKALGSKPGKIEILARTLGQSQDADDKLGKNWNLAQARCDSTMRYLVTLGIDPARIRIGVAAQFEPTRSGAEALFLENKGSVEVFTLNGFSEDARAESTDHARD